jgi:hypothetical protein
MSFETRGMPRFYLIPALILGAAVIMAWEEPRLAKAIHDADHWKAENHTSILSAWSWHDAYWVKAKRLDELEQQAANALTDAEARQRTSNKTSFAAGVIAGRALERSRHEKAVANGSPDPAADDTCLYVDLRGLWRGEETAIRAAIAGGETLPAGSPGCVTK